MGDTYPQLHLQMRLYACMQSPLLTLQDVHKSTRVRTWLCLQEGSRRSVPSQNKLTRICGSLFSHDITIPVCGQPRHSQRPSRPPRPRRSRFDEQQGLLEYHIGWKINMQERVVQTKSVSWSAAGAGCRTKSQKHDEQRVGFLILLLFF
jgi:hypothetical protein